MFRIFVAAGVLVFALAGPTVAQPPQEDRLVSLLMDSLDFAEERIATLENDVVALWSEAADLRARVRNLENER